LNDYNLVIDCFAGYFTQLLNPVEGFCVELAPCWCVGCHVNVWLANLLARGVARALWLPGLSLSPLRIPFCEFSQMYALSFLVQVRLHLSLKVNCSWAVNGNGTRPKHFKLNKTVNAKRHKTLWKGKTTTRKLSQNSADKNSTQLNSYAQ